MPKVPPSSSSASKRAPAPAPSQDSPAAESPPAAPPTTASGVATPVPTPPPDVPCGEASSPPEATNRDIDQWFAELQQMQSIALPATALAVLTSLPQRFHRAALGWSKLMVRATECEALAGEVERNLPTSGVEITLIAQIGGQSAAGSAEKLHLLKKVRAERMADVTALDNQHQRVLDQEVSKEEAGDVIVALAGVTAVEDIDGAAVKRVRIEKQITSLRRVIANLDAAITIIARQIAISEMRGHAALIRQRVHQRLVFTTSTMAAIPEIVARAISISEPLVGKGDPATALIDNPSGPYRDLMPPERSFLVEDQALRQRAEESIDAWVNRIKERA